MCFFKKGVIFSTKIIPVFIQEGRLIKSTPQNLLCELIKAPEYYINSFCVKTCLNAYLKPVPFCTVPLRVQRLPAHISLVRDASELDLHKRIRGVPGAVHHRQVPPSQNLHLNFPWHVELFTRNLTQNHTKHHLTKLFTQLIQIH